MKLKERIKAKVVKEVKDIVAEEVESGVDILKTFVLPNTYRALAVLAVTCVLLKENRPKEFANITFVILKGGNLL